MVLVLGVVSTRLIRPSGHGACQSLCLPFLYGKRLCRCSRWTQHGLETGSERVGCRVGQL